MRPKKCKNCGKKFYPKYRTTETVCSYSCAAKFGKTNAAKTEKELWRKRKTKLKKELETLSDLIKAVQKIFNTYIRLRDKDKGCISCGKPFNQKYDAGHYRSVGSAPELRFNEMNVHGQCVHCNQHLGANLIEYRKGLIGRYNIELVEDLERKHEPLHLTKPEVRELMKVYKQKIKEL